MSHEDVLILTNYISLNFVCKKTKKKKNQPSANYFEYVFKVIFFVIKTDKQKYSLAI